MLVVFVLFATVLLRAAIVLTFVYVLLPVKRVCPLCYYPSLSTAGASIAVGAAWCARLNRA